jgi:ferredoxin
MQDGKAVVKDKNSKDKSNKEAEDICPVKAIIIE